MRRLSAEDNRSARARPPLRPNALAISEAVMTYIVLNAKHKSKRQTSDSARGKALHSKICRILSRDGTTGSTMHALRS
jgi:hypothetical protein